MPTLRGAGDEGEPAVASRVVDLDELATLSKRDLAARRRLLKARQDELEADLRRVRLALEITRLAEAETTTRADAARRAAAARKRTEQARAKRVARRRAPARPRDARLQRDLTERDLPRFAIPRERDPTGLKARILGVMWLGRGAWTPSEVAEWLRDAGLDPDANAQKAQRTMSRMAVGDTPLLVRPHGTHDYEVPPGVEPTSTSPTVDRRTERAAVS